MEFGGTRRFQVLSRLGEGAVGVVYEALDRERNQRVALKTLRALSGEALLTLKNEFRAVQDLAHPNLIELGELIEEGGRWFFTMELLAGPQEFLRWVRPGGRLDEERLRAALVQLAHGLAALHDANKVHRDLKPSNVLVTNDGRVVILDFGVMRDADARGDDAIVGTASYMAPEQAAGEALGPAADWYAVGVMLYEALTGELPFVGSVTEVLTAKLSEEAPAPRLRAPDTNEELDALCVDLMRLDPDARPNADDVLRRLHAAPHAETTMSRNVFVGRRRELAAMTQAFEHARDRAVSVLLRGDSGVGKTALARRFTEWVNVHARGALLFAGRCYERESVAFKGIDGILDQISEYLRTLPDHEVRALMPTHPRLLVQVFPVLEEVRVFAEARYSEMLEVVPDEMRRRVFAAVRELIGAIAAKHRVVLMIDDVQWANPDAVALLSALLAPPAAPPILVLMTLRTDASSARAPSLPGEVRDVAVEKLAPEDARELAQRLLGSASAGDVDALVKEAQGHPLFLDELARQRATSGAASGVFRLDDALWARVTRLPDEAREVMSLLAVASIPLPQDTIATAAALDPARFSKVVTTLRSARLARTDGAGRQAPVATYHDRVRESVLTRLGDGDRARCHGALAEALERQGSADAETLAVHWQGAGQSERGAEYALKAAEDASRSLAFERASRLYAAALGLRAWPKEKVVEIQRKRAEALTNDDRLAEAAAIRLELARDAAPIDALDLRRHAAEQLLCSAHFVEGNRTMAEVVAELGVRMPQSPLGALVLFIFQRILMRFEGLKLAERSVVDHAEQVKVDCTWSAGQGFLMTDNIRGIYFMAINLRSALRSGDQTRAMRSLVMEALAGGSVDRERTKRLTEQARAIADKLGTPYAQAMIACAEGGAAYFWGEWARAAPRLIEAESLLRERCVAVTFELNSIRMMLFRTLAFLGEVRQIEGRLPALVRDAEQREDNYALVVLRTVGGVTLDLARDDAEHARAQLEAAERHLTAVGYHVQHYLCAYSRANLDLYVGKAEEVYAQLADVWKKLRRAMLTRVEIIRVLTLDVRARAALALAQARPTDAPRLLEEADRWGMALEKEPAAWAHALASVIRAGALAAKGDKAATIAALEKAHALVDAAAMRPQALALRHRMATLRGDGAAAREVEEAMRAQGLAAPARWIAMLAPGAYG